MNNIILIAPPAAGKGTQSEFIKAKYQIPIISVEELFVKQLSDEVILQLLAERISRPDCINGYVLDDYPRNIAQAEGYLRMLQALNEPLGKVIYLNLPQETARKRVVGRLYCTNCNTMFNDQFDDSKPKRFGTCDNCNASLTRKEEDNEDSFNERYNKFKDETEPLVEFFEKKGLLFRVGSGISKERTFSEIEKILR